MLDQRAFQMPVSRPTAEHFEPTNCGTKSRKMPVSNAQRSNKVKVNLWWAEADEGVRIPGWPIIASKRSGLLLGKEDEVETQLKQNGLVLVMSEWKGGSKYKKTRRRRRQTRRLDSNLVKRKNKLTHPR